MIVELPKLTPVYLKRQFYVWHKKYGSISEEEMKNEIDNRDNLEIETVCFKDYTFELAYWFDEETEEFEIRAYISVKKISIYITDIRNTPENFNSYIDNKFKLRYEFCTCGNLVFEDGLCESCFVFSYENEEECAICKENEPNRWYELECGHVFHMNCIKKVKNNKCPLCRKEIKVKNHRYPF